jgi:hypothetical protein
MEEIIASSSGENLPPIKLEDSPIDYLRHSKYALEGRCFICSRLLTKESSVLRGTGDICAQNTNFMEFERSPDSVPLKVKNFLNINHQFSLSADDISFVRLSDSGIVYLTILGTVVTIPLKYVVHVNGVLLVHIFYAHRIKELNR